MAEIVRIGNSSVIMLKEASDTDGRFSMMELTVQPGGTIFGAHLHLDCDQTVIGVEGIAVWTVASELVVVGPGERILIPRGTMHTVHNRQGYAARCLCIFSPARLSAEFFIEVSKAYEFSGAERIAHIDAALARFHMLPIASAS